MRRLRARQAAFAAQAPEALLVIYFGLATCEGYIRQQIARDFQENPHLCWPDGRPTRPLPRVRPNRHWHEMMTLAVTWVGMHGQRTEVDKALRARKDPNATQPMKLEEILK